MTKNRTAALRRMIGQHVHIRRGDARLADGNLIGPLDMLPEAVGLWGAVNGVDSRLTVYGFDPHDSEIIVTLASQVQY